LYFKDEVFYKNEHLFMVKIVFYWFKNQAFFNLIAVCLGDLKFASAPKLNTRIVWQEGSSVFVIPFGVLFFE